MESRTPQTNNQEADAGGTIDIGTAPSPASEHQKLHEVDDDDDDEDENVVKNNHGTSSSNRNDQSFTNTNSSNNNTSRKSMMMSNNESNADAMVTGMNTASSRAGVGNTIGLNGGGGTNFFVHHY